MVIKDIYDFVIPYYEEKHRVFHDIEHLKLGIFMLETFERKGEIISDVQYTAWLFHDIIYKLDSNTNEEDSAAFFEVCNKEQDFGFEDSEVQKVKQIILDTKKHKATIEDSKIVLDVDMHSLALPWHSFIENRQKVEEEYSAIYSTAEVQKGVLHFIDTVLRDKNIIFHTSFYKEYFLDTAIDNLIKYRDIINNS